MALDTRDNLKLEIADWLDRTDLTDRIDTFIRLAESRHRREIRTRSMLVHEVAFAITDGDRYLAFPMNFLDIKSLRVLIPDVISGRRYYPDVNYVTPTEMADLSSNSEFRPCNYTVHTQIELDYEADQDYTAELFYYSPYAALTTGNQTNALLTDAPDAYLYGALAASAPFLLHDERVQLWESLYKDVRDTLNSTEIENKHPGPLADRVQNIPQRVLR